jgi:hypothetical protein
MKLIKFLGVATAATAIGWAIGGVVLIVAAGRFFEQADLDDDAGAFMPQQVFERVTRQGAYVGGPFAAWGETSEPIVLSDEEWLDLCNAVGLDPETGLDAA